MKKSFSIIAALLVVLMGSSYAHENETLVVKLATESQLIPLYLRSFISQNAGFDKEYLNRLEEVLKFDLSHNGMTQTVPHNGDKDRVASRYTFEQADDPLAWKALNVFYVIKARVEDKKLSVRMLAMNSASIKKADNIQLTGDFKQDRRIMHQVADMIHKALFNTDGIASTRFIYTHKIGGSEEHPVSEVWEADYDGGNARQLTHENALCVTPSYLPPKPGCSCSNFFYVSYKTGQPKIYIGSLKDKKVQRLTYLPGNQLMPVLSQQRDKVAFVCDTTGNPDLFVQPFSPEAGAIGKPQQAFAGYKATQGTPTFSPDGKKIAFVSNKDGSPRIYVIDVPSPGIKVTDIKATLISKNGKESTAPAWSPDGTKIAYTSTSQGVRQIWIYDCTTKSERQLTQGPGHKENPTWAPNSLHLIFNSVNYGSSDLYLINLNQPEAYKISSGKGEKRFPSWESKT